eukprot:Colp12_sorted_trinity150504_noHs@16652
MLLSAPSRIVILGSEAHRGANKPFEAKDLPHALYEGSMASFRAYANSKLCNMLHALALSERLKGTGVTANSVHPGTVRTEIFSNVGTVLKVLMTPFMYFFKTPEQGAATSLYVATSPECETVSGRYFKDSQQAATMHPAYNPHAADALWELSDKLIAEAEIASLQQVGDDIVQPKEAASSEQQ